jgi:hypothetical protein
MQTAFFLSSFFYILCSFAPQGRALRPGFCDAKKQCHPERSGAAAQSKDLHWDTQPSSPHKGERGTGLPARPAKSVSF